MVNLYYGTTIKTIDAPIVTYESLIWTERYNSYGDFEIVLAYDDSIFSTFVPGSFFVHSSESKKVMIGDRLELENGLITITGRDLSWVLNRRLRNNSSRGVNYLPHAWIDLVIEPLGSLGTFISRIPEFRNLGVSSEDKSKFDSLPKGTHKGEWKDLYSIVEEIAKTHNFGFRADWNPSAETIDWRLYFGVDRSIRSSALQTVILSPKLDNLIDGRYIITNDGFFNDGWVSGSGTINPSTSLISSTDPNRTRPRGWDRHEGHVDLSEEFVYSDWPSQSEFNTALRQAGLSYMDSYGRPRPTYDGKLTDLGPYKYGTHFNMGDIVLLVTEFGHETRSRVVEYTTSVNDEGTTSYPTLESV